MSTLTEKTSRLRDLRAQVRALAAEVEAEKQAFYRSRLKSLGPHQRTVLAHLAEDFHEDEWFSWSFRALAKATGLDRAQVRRACKALRRVGFVKLEIGLWSDDGEMAGSGYRVTKEGAAYSAALSQPVAA